MRLLIADSDSTLAEIYSCFFSREGYDVETAGDALECLKCTRDSLPDVLVLEYELPFGGGELVLASLRNGDPFLPIRIVLITCDYSVEDLSYELVSPVMGCLRKPFPMCELSELVQTSMSIVETLPRPVAANGAQANRCRVVRRRVDPPKATERPQHAGTPPVAELQQQRDRVVEDQVNALLIASSYQPIRGVSCEVCNNVLTLQGRLPNFYMKQIAQTTVRHLLEAGIVVNNQLEVDWP